MHIGLVSPAWPVDELPNGISTYVHNMRSELIAQGHRVSVFCNFLGGANRDAGVHLVEPSLAYKIRRKLSGGEDAKSYNFLNWGEPLAAKVNEVHRSNPLDIIEMDEFWGWCAVVQALVSPPVLVKLHGPAFLDLVEEERQSDRAQTRIEREGQGLSKMPALIAPTHATLDETLRRYGLAPYIGKVIPNPVPFPEADKIWKLDSCDRKTMIFVGRFDKRKGGDTVLLAFRKLLEADDSLKLIFVGPDLGLTSSDGARVQFQEFVESLFSTKQRQQISYLGRLPPGDIPDVRRKAMVTIVASRWESQGYTALEAMAQACPVVAVNTGGLGETVEHKVTGLLAGLDDIEDLCSKIMSILNDPAQATLLGMRARDAVVSRHSMPKLAKQAIDVYSQVISIHRKQKLASNGQQTHTQ